MAKSKVKVKDNSGLAKFNRFLSIVVAILLVATVCIVAFSAPKVAVQEGAEGEVQDESVLEAEFKPGTYAGIEFKTVEDVINFYKEAYNYSKTLTAQYKDKDGKTQTFYKLLGEEKLDVGNIKIGGSSNAMINNLVPGIVDGLGHVGGAGIKDGPGNGLGHLLGGHGPDGIGGDAVGVVFVQHMLLKVAG